MEEIRILCVGGGNRSTVMATFKDNEFQSKSSGSQHEPIHVTTVVRGQPKKLIVEDFDSNKAADNYQNVDIVLIFFDCATDSEDFAAATRYSVRSLITRLALWFAALQCLSLLFLNT